MNFGTVGIRWVSGCRRYKELNWHPTDGRIDVNQRATGLIDRGRVLAMAQGQGPICET
ncbi:MAG: hypothetical protein ACLPKB_11235 [Xanthobacteraceae bacterium]